MDEIQKNKLKKIITRLFVFMLLFSLTFSSVLPAGAAESDTDRYFSNDYILQIINDMPAVDTNLFEQVKSAENTIAVSGTVPAFSRGRESYEWFVLLRGVVTKVRSEGKLEPYLWDNGGFVIGYGCPNSYVQIFVYSGSDYSDEDINTMIQIVQDAGRSYGVDNIPVVVISSTHAQGFDDSISIYQQPVESPVESEKTIPGVGLAACAVLSLIVVLFTRSKK